MKICNVYNFFTDIYTEEVNRCRTTRSYTGNIRPKYVIHFGLCHNHLLAEEITQETFYRAISPFTNMMEPAKYTYGCVRLPKSLLHNPLDDVGNRMFKDPLQIAKNVKKRPKLVAKLVAFLLVLIIYTSLRYSYIRSIKKCPKHIVWGIKLVIKVLRHSRLVVRGCLVRY